MSSNIKKEIKEWLQLIAMTAVSGIVVLHVNGMLSPKTDKDTKQEKTENVQPVTQNDSITNHALNNVKQLKRQR